MFDENGNRKDARNLCCNQHGNACCPQCRLFWDRLIVYLRDSTRKGKTFTPYIHSVTNHWFRDVYFSIDDVDKVELVKVDEAYEAETGERWTEYEMDGDNYALYLLDSDGNITNDRYKGTSKEAKENGIAVSKKAITKNVTPNNGRSWIAYDIADVDTDTWEKVFTEEDLKQIPDEEDRIMFSGIEVNFGKVGDVTQIEDGQRGVTNPLTKKIFSREYFQYDGTPERAKEIYNTKYSNGYYYNKTDWGFLGINGEFQGYPMKYGYVDRSNIKSFSYRLNNIMSKVNIDRDSLAAFSMLENMHTLDADYIYRDFKELIVELDYFNKEDLTEYHGPVFEWLIPAISSSGWPVRALDKNEDYYGTLIQSSTDYDILKSEKSQKSERKLDGLAESDENVSTGSAGRTVEIDNNGEIDITISDFLASVIKICTEAQNNSIQYSVVPSNLKTIWDGTNEYWCNNYMVSWALQQCGIFKSYEIKSIRDIYQKLKTEYKAEEITDKSELKPGDIVFYYDKKVKWKKIDILGEKNEDGTFVKYTADPEDDSIGKFNPYGQDENYIFKFALRLNFIDELIVNFEGFKGEEAVVSPTSGILLDYGTAERKNITTGLMEEVGYAKIKVLSQEDVMEKNGARSFNHFLGNVEKNTAGKYEINGSEETAGYECFYNDYKSSEVDGNIIFIEGFECKLPDGNYLTIDSFKDGYDENLYKKKTQFSLTSKLLEQKQRVEEDARYSAKAAMRIGDKIYIKEGTVIGRTYKKETYETSSETNAPGNYVRIVMRDKEDEVIENIEDYINLEDNKIKVVDQEYVQANDGNDIYRLANIIHFYMCKNDFIDLGSKVRNGAGEWVKIDEEDAETISKACGYVYLNKCILNDQKLEELLSSGGRWEQEYANATTCSCAECLNIAAWCLTYDCSSVRTSEGVTMTRNCNKFDYQDIASTDLERFWLIDWHNNNFVRTLNGADGRLVDGYDIFFYRDSSMNSEYGADSVMEYDESMINPPE